MKKLYVIGMIAAVSAAACMTACGGKSTIETTVASNSDPESIKIDTKKLSNGSYYIRHQDGTLEPLYFGASTFDKGTTVSTPSSDRVIWFRGDEGKIPKLYAGDLLLYYSTNELSETFNFERFEDLGYSVGLCHMQLTPSGRYSISTKKDDNTTYPGSDADAILDDRNANVLIDTIGGIELRSEKDENGSMTGTYLTRCGTLSGLNRDESYAVQMYSGTERLNTVSLIANVDIMGSFETFSTHDFKFLASDNVISLTIPEFMQSGWYAIDAEGVFKYVKGTAEEEDGLTYDDPITDAPEEVNYQPLVTNKEASDIESSLVASNKESTFKVTQEGEMTVSVELTVPENMQSVVYDYPEATMVLTAPDGTTYPLTPDENGIFTCHFDTAQAGEYKINYYNLENRVPNLTVS